jgi:hypothetical protein
LVFYRWIVSKSACSAHQVAKPALSGLIEARRIETTAWLAFLSTMR